MAFRFRNFTIYQEAKQFINNVFNITVNFPLNQRFELTTQINRTALSIILNIAEGSDKNSDKEFAKFLRISLGSLNELVAGFDFAKDQGLIKDKEFNNILEKATVLSRKLAAFIKTLCK
ncbi:hypothetical protein COS81_02645 [candidate division WWE3 bacterium CG06_land_8_20_14_3_00_42_16]|uniref:Four helix bundle protein n=4 Tax=Katanobacteria TaxID=422282 RepID=A0A2M7AN06_UNCKA|nr:MAG: hypothetical protein AUJ38_00035 [bacterium CG1_02_42_9]PIU68776.1 MAG: hypothetical protein COS81_02645 [candidate division WWE3 bacterium CG06_land_8_20_14_3_00_42_16]PIZ43460.1 MAG: hypothetical protein COY34_00855 [candidate division WWE3 bacterium CG_4_10_14_0_2_um_filter_42_8]PJA37718.1 MAG: hypothetical protein CO181_02285 [candidate division WWE3 bacterium CG_4_9_14_3_um_filter_43_9]PJC68933.1 MAG: hypothetical protein CO015_02235 [candidate division WWE3 bacterium CG_4_8_14_3_u